MMALLRSAYRLARSMVYHDPFAARKAPRFQPHLEELETRALLSLAGGLGPIAAPQFHLTPLASLASSPYTPDQVRHAYGFNKLSYNGSGQTIAIVDAFNNPNIESDLKNFDAQFGVAPPPSFTKATPQGTPANDAGWAGEISLDVEWAHAIAPNAKILLVEAASASDGDLKNAVDYARQQPGVVAVSMSWGGAEFAGETAYDSIFTTPSGHGGVAFVSSAGDDGAGAEWPAVSPNVVAVGGTGLAITSSGANYVGETAWSSGGGGVSRYETEPGFQSQNASKAGFGVLAQTSGKRGTPDVAYNADPNTGFYVYDTYPDAKGETGWFAYGGTSAGAPQWAALIALADQGRAQAGLGALTNVPAVLYSLSATDFNDVTSGNNGAPAGPGYDLVTGRGSPIADKLVADLVVYGAAAPTQTPPTLTKPTTVPKKTHGSLTSGKAAASTAGASVLPRDSRAEETVKEWLRGLHRTGRRPQEDIEPS